MTFRGWSRLAVVSLVACQRAPAQPDSSCAAVDEALEPVPEGQAASTMAAYACMAWVGCTCDVLGAQPVPSCRHGLNMSYEYLQSEADAHGLEYDGHCLAQHVADLAAIGCDDMPAMEDWSVTGPGRCAIWHGTKGLDDDCVSLGHGISDCAQGLACWAGRCADPCAAESVGERCGKVFDFACAANAVCVSDECVDRSPPAEIGASCESGECVPGAFCRQLCPAEECTYECIEARDDGVLCNLDAECKSGFCAEGACATGPVTGEPCVAERCFEGRECVDGICGDPEGVICRS